MEENKAYQARLHRFKTAIDLQEADRVPFAPKIGGFYANGYGLDMYAMMKDLRTAAPCMQQFLQEYEPDMVWPAITYPIDPVETLGCTYIKTPGPTHGLPLDASFQFLDGTYMEDDEFSEFLLDPTHFMLTKVMPRKNKSLQALERLYFREIYDHTAIMELSVLSDDEVRKALYALVRTGEFAQRTKEQSGYMAGLVKNAGFPLRGGTILTPFDVYADSLRGLIQALMDVVERPEETLEVVNRIADLNLDREVAMAKARGDLCTHIPLHAGGDEFMSVKDYEKFYWPGLKRLITKMVDNGLTPLIFCEGKYETRLEILCDVPKGKVIYMFEETDMKRVKQIVGNYACICGNLPAAMLAYGTREEIVTETKKLLDICAPGGGFIMDCSIVLENATHENMRAWKETTLTYGSY